MEKFAGYGFNKSHSAAYALLAYQTAWLKTHYPAEFMASVMSSDMQNTDKVVTFVDECHSMNINVTPPDINSGHYTFTVNESGEIVYGLGAIKGLGEGAIESLLEGREAGGPYQHLFDFCARVDLRRVNKRSLEALIVAGAFDTVGPKSEPGRARATLMALLPEAVQAAEQQLSNASAGMADLFGEVVKNTPTNDTSIYDTDIRIFPWSNRELLQKERDTIGLYLTGHPLDDYIDELQELCGSRINNLRVSRNKQWIGGLVIDMRRMKTKRGDTMCILTLDDRSGRIEITLFSDAFNAVQHLIAKDAILLVEGIVEHDDYSGATRVRGESVRTLYEARSARVRSLQLQLCADEPASIGVVADIKKRMTPYLGGECPVHLQIQYQGFRGKINLEESWNIQPKDELLQELKNVLGAKAVQLAF